MVLCLGEPPRRFLLMFFISFCCHLSIFFIHILVFDIIPHPSVGFYTHFIISAQPIAEWFATLSFSTIPSSSYREHYGFELAFLLTGIFLPYAPSPTFMTQPTFIKASLGGGSFSLKFAGLHTDPWNTDLAHLFVWFTVIHKRFIYSRLYLRLRAARICEESAPGFELFPQ